MHQNVKILELVTYNNLKIKRDEFQQACKTIFPKVDHRLIEDLLRQQEDTDASPLMFTIEVLTKKGVNTQEMKDWIWNKAG